MNHRIVRAVALFLLSVGALQATETSSAGVELRNQTTFALGGIGFAGVMSEGERTLREILKEPDAARRLQSVLPNASPAGQLYALLGLRLRDRAAYQRALEKYRANNAKVQTMRGCILQQESFGKLITQIEHGDYDSFLEREWPEHKR